MSRFLAASLMLLVAPTSCVQETTPEPLKVVSWSGQDGKPVSLDQVLKIEFDRPLAQPLRASSVELLDEGEHVVKGMDVSVVGRWIHLNPSLPLTADLDGGSLRPNSTYAIHLHGLPWLRALTGEDGQRLPQDLALRFNTAKVDAPGALAGRGVESSTLQLHGGAGREPLVFQAEEPILLRFTRGLDPRSLEATATWRLQGQGEGVPVQLQLLENRIDGAVMQVELDDWIGWGVLELPASLEGLGGWPLPQGDRLLRLVRRG
ncbi:MAG: hypothetical protein ACPG31_04375 [Planctomycetota bacterium]